MSKSGLTTYGLADVFFVYQPENSGSNSSANRTSNGSSGGGGGGMDLMAEMQKKLARRRMAADGDVSIRYWKFRKPRVAVS